MSARWIGSLSLFKAGFRVENSLFVARAEKVLKRRKRREEIGHIEQFYAKSKKKARVNPADVPMRNQVLHTRENEVLDKLEIEGCGILRDAISTVLGKF